MTGLTGRIVKGLGGFYYVDTGEGIYECRGRGIFRKDNTKLLTGDVVDIEITHEADMEGSIVNLHPRKSVLKRPEVSNVDLALVVFALKDPEPNLILLDRFLITMADQNVDTVLVWNKKDLVDDKECARMLEAYRGSGAACYAVSAKDESSLSALKEVLKGRISLVAGPSGVGKSTILNILCPHAYSDTGEISKKMKRGRHTTRHSELFAIDEDSFLMDTPGFTALELDGQDEDTLKAYYPEFFPYEGKCRFNPCSHTHEPACAVREAAENGSISGIRFDNYKSIYQKQKENRRY